MNWIEKEVLVLVKAYPQPSKKYGEVVCTAGITKDGEWIRLYPIRFRDLRDDKQYKKWQWIKVMATPSDEPLKRPESFKIDSNSIEILGYIPPGKKYLGEREKHFMPMVSPHLEVLMKLKDERKLSLGAFKPKIVTDFIIEEGDQDWSQSQIESLSRQDLFETEPKTTLQKVPYNFRYKFECDNPECRGHSMVIIDWEVNQAYRQFKATYKDEEEAMGGTLNIQKIGDGPMKDQMPKEMHNKVMHGSLTFNNHTIGASDMFDGGTPERGNAFSLALDCKDEAEMEKLWKAFLKGGKVGHEIMKTFWGAFGDLDDKFGVNWMLNYTKPGMGAKDM